MTSELRIFASISREPLGSENWQYANKPRHHHVGESERYSQFDPRMCAGFLPGGLKDRFDSKWCDADAFRSTIHTAAPCCPWPYLASLRSKRRGGACGGARAIPLSRRPWYGIRINIHITMLRRQSKSRLILIFRGCATQIFRMSREGCINTTNRVQWCQKLHLVWFSGR